MMLERHTKILTKLFEIASQIAMKLMWGDVMSALSSHQPTLLALLTLVASDIT